MAGEEAAAAAEGRGAGNSGGSYDGKCVFCRIARREEPGTALLPCQVGEGRPGSGGGLSRCPAGRAAALRRRPLSSGTGAGASSPLAAEGPSWAWAAACLLLFVAGF